jgi:hypothetical protein
MESTQSRYSSHDPHFYIWQPLSPTDFRCQAVTVARLGRGEAGVTATFGPNLREIETHHCAALSLLSKRVV